MADGYDESKELLENQAANAAKLKAERTEAKAKALADKTAAKAQARAAKFGSITAATVRPRPTTKVSKPATTITR